MQITFPGPGILYICGIRYELSGNFYLVSPKLLPLSFVYYTNVFNSYFVTGGLTVRVLVKSDLSPYPNEVLRLES